MEQTLKQYIAVRAVIVRENQVLVIREASKYEGGTNHGLYDFPGGKIKPGETITEAVNRETKEEAGIEVSVGKPFFVHEWRPIIKEEQVQIICIFFICKIADDTDIKIGEDFDDYKWMSLDKPIDLPLMKDKVVIIEALKKELGFE
jgi:8-oxo-dGTP diphosphatase